MPEQIGSCAYCGKPGKWLCDFVVIHNRVGGNTTCDRPLCDDHRRMQSSGIACTRGKGGGCRRFSVDYCPHHDDRKWGRTIPPTVEQVAEFDRLIADLGLSAETVAASLVSRGLTSLSEGSQGQAEEMLGVLRERLAKREPPKQATLFPAAQPERLPP